MIIQCRDAGGPVPGTRGSTLLAVLAAACIASPAWAQRSGGAAAPAFVFASAAEARDVLGARDDYVRAMTPVERSARLRTTETVEEDRFRRHMQDTAREWSAEQRQNLTPLLDRLAGFVAGMKWRIPERILMVLADPALEDDSPHTRDNAIVMSPTYYARGPVFLEYLLAHETFHVITRANSELKERLYAAIGFRSCESVVVPPAVARLRITNPDAVESRHTIRVRHRGEPVEALPYVRFAAADSDPRDGFMQHLQVAWLLVDRKGTQCHARSGADENGVAPQDLEGLYEQIGRNTEYLFHPEEILADNFSFLYLSTIRGSQRGIASPDLIERLRKLLFE